MLAEELPLLEGRAQGQPGKATHLLEKASRIGSQAGELGQAVQMQTHHQENCWMWAINPLGQRYRPARPIQDKGELGAAEGQADELAESGRCSREKVAMAEVPIDSQATRKSRRKEELR